MSGFRIPTPFGSGVTLDIDVGTLMRATSLPSLPLGVRDQFLDWVRKEIRRGAMEALRYAGALAYEAVMLEIRELEHDLVAQAKLIASLPRELRDRVAYEVYAAWFDHYLPKKFLRAYIWGDGADVTLTLQEMIDCNPAIDLRRSKVFLGLLDQAKGQPGRAFPFEGGVLSGAMTNGTLGQFTARVKGTLVGSADGAWKISGTMAFHDVWDFDSKDFKKGGRSLQGELKTRVGSFLPGKGFNIESVSTTFSQSEADETVVWAGGTPQFVPDRISAVDVAVDGNRK